MNVYENFFRDILRTFSMPGVQSTERKEVLQQNGIESQPIFPFIEGQMLSSFHTTPIK